MKLFTSLAVIAAASALASVASAQVFDPIHPAAQVAPVGIDPQVHLDLATAHAALDPHGSWVATGAYGDVWTPSAITQNFVPYGTNGQWVQTDAGWYWQSELPWGAVTFHYGRWIRLATGWAWAFGDTFAPAWVDWRMSSDGMVGWAPLPPNGSPDATWYAYLQPSMLGAMGFWPSALYGYAASGYHARSYALPRGAGYGGAQYAYGPRIGAVSLPLGHAWQRDFSRGRGTMAQPVGPRFATPVMAAPPRLGPPSGGYGTPVYGFHYGARPAGVPEGRPAGGFHGGGGFRGGGGFHGGGGFRGGGRH